MAKARKRKKKPTGVPLRIKTLVVTMLLLLVTGVASVKFFQTNSGRLVLLDLGFTDYYSQVQETIDTELRWAIANAGLAGGLKERVKTQTVSGKQLHYREWTATCKSKCRFIDLNLRMSDAVKRASGVVRSSSEVDKDDRAKAQALTFDIGSRRHTTHRLTIRHPLKGAAPPRTGPLADKERAPDRVAARTPNPADFKHNGRPKVALVIDDFGYSKNDLIESFFELDIPFTCAIIPSLPHSRYAIERAKAAKKQPILHLPMEAEAMHSEVPPVLVSMTDSEIETLLERYIGLTKGVVGVNNHLGSVATQDERVMTRVASIVKTHKLYFLDSLTSNKSIAYTTARSHGVRTARNDIFLDADTEDDQVVEERLLRLIEIAKKKGTGIGIGHPKPWTYRAIKRNHELMKRSGVEWVLLSELVH